MLRLFTLLCVLFVALFPAMAQDEEAETPEIEWVCPEGFEGQTLSVYNWATYIGETTIADFEELCGVDVVYDVYDGNEALIARLRQGNPGYDVAFPGDYAVAIMIRDGLLETIDTSTIPNYENIAERWLGLPFDPENEYSVPYLWGTFGPAYNVEAVGEEITSWQQVFNYDGNVAWVDDARSMTSIALTNLGYDPNSTNEDEISEARDFLIDNGGNVVAVAEDDGQALLSRGEVDIALEYNGDIYQLIVDCECEDYAYVIPEEGSVVDLSLMVILKDAPNPELAKVFIDYILDPAVSAMIVNSTFYATANQAAIDSGYISEDLLSNTAIFPNEDSLENLYFLSDVSDAEQAYNDAWDEVIILIGG